MDFREEFYKTVLRGRISGYTISLDTVLSLFDGEVTGWYFGNLNNQPSGSNQWSACSSLLLLVGVLVSAKQLRNVCQIHTDIRVLQGGTNDSVIAVWLIYCLNCYQFSWPNCTFLFLHVHILLIINS